MADSDLDYYEVLGLSPAANEGEIRAAHRRLVKERHPDSGGTAEMFRLLQTAYEVLADPTARDEYDRQLAARQRGVPPTSPKKGFDLQSLVGQPAGATVEYLEAAGIHPIIRMVAVNDPRLDGVIIEVDSDTATLTIGVTQSTAGWFARLGFFALQTAWQMTKRGAATAARVADSGMKEIEASRAAGPGYEISRAWKASGCMAWIYGVYALTVVLIIAAGSMPGGLRVFLLILGAVMLAPFAIAVAIHRGARRAFYRQNR